MRSFPSHPLVLVALLGLGFATARGVRHPAAAADGPVNIGIDIGKPGQRAIPIGLPYPKGGASQAQDFWGVVKRDLELTGYFTVLDPNSPPTGPGVDIVPNEPTAGDSLLCEIATASTDPDGDAVNYTFAWDVDGAAYTSASTTSEVGDTVPGGLSIAGQVWTCTVTPNDGTDDGPPGSASVCSRGCAPGRGSPPLPRRWRRRRGAGRRR